MSCMARQPITGRWRGGWRRGIRTEPPGVAEYLVKVRPSWKDKGETAKRSTYVLCRAAQYIGFLILGAAAVSAVTECHVAKSTDPLLNEHEGKLPGFLLEKNQQSQQLYIATPVTMSQFSYKRHS